MTVARAWWWHGVWCWWVTRCSVNPARLFLISLYHGSQQFWLGLPLYAIFGTTVTGVRLTHATFALFVLAALFALLVRGGARPWLAALTCACLALDCAFSYSFRVQAYITVAPAAWLLMGLYALTRATRSAEHYPGRWLVASGALCGLAAVGYFIWAFVLPPIAAAVVCWTARARFRRPPIVLWVAGLAAGGAAYPVGYLLIARKLGSFTQMFEFFVVQQSTIGAFGSQLSLADRVRSAWRTTTSVLGSDWHQTMMFNGEFTSLGDTTWKAAVLLGVPYALWTYAEVRQRATPLLRLLASLPISFFAVSLVFGERLGGHHFAAMVPMLYAMLGAALATLSARIHGVRAATVVAPLALLAILNAAGQIRISETLQATRGKGQLSDAIHRFAADLNAMPDKPFVWFAEPAPALPLTLLTRGAIAMGDHLDDPEPRRRLCASRDVMMVRIPAHFSEPRGREWQRGLEWDPPVATAYTQADGRVVFEVLVYRGRRDGPGCA